jgi:stage II sporulation protein D
VVVGTSPETYLLGIDEMPFSWNSAALQAQVIAARTYLANLVAFPRWGLMATYGFDICDTTSCQVYEGIGVIDRAAGDRWRAAVEATAGQILLYEGRPAAALYHAAAGSATRSIQDVWMGSSAVPYLQAVPIADEGSVYSHWKFKIPLDAFVDILAADGITFDGPIPRSTT